MAASDTEIVNLALIALGAETIESLDDDGNGAAVTARTVYAACRDALLRAYPWRFAIRRAVLTAAAPGAVAFGFTYAWQLPDACLRVLSIGDRPCDPPEPYSVEGEALLTDAEPPVPIRYIVRVTEAPRFDASFVEILGLKLAAAMCERITGSTSKMEALDARAARLVREARRLGAMEQPPQPVAQPSDWLGARL